MDRRHELQAELDALLVTLFRRRPQLSYFQVRTLLVSWNVHADPFV